MLENNALYYSRYQPIKRVIKKIIERFHGGIQKYVSLSYHLCLQCCLSSSISIQLSSSTHISCPVYFILIHKFFKQNYQISRKPNNVSKGTTKILLSLVITIISLKQISNMLICVHGFESCSFESKYIKDSLATKSCNQVD